MPAECIRAAGLNGRHHLELSKADMPNILLPPRGTVRTEDIGDLELRAGHRPRTLLQSALHRLILKLLNHLKRAYRVTDRFGCHMGVLGRRRQFGMTQ